MAQSIPMGARAQIITNARFDRPPVVQTPRRGRLPNSVIKFWKAGGDIRMMRYLAQERQQEIEATRQRIADHGQLVSYFQGRLATLTQTKGAAHV